MWKPFCVKGSICSSYLPTRPSPTAVVRKAFEAGTPVLVLDRSVEGDAYTCFIGADNRRNRPARAGEQIVKMLQGKGRIVEIKGMPGSPPAIERSEGFREVIQKQLDWRLFITRSELERDEGKTQMEIALKAHEKIDLVYAHNDPMAIGAWLAAKASNRDTLIQLSESTLCPAPMVALKLSWMGSFRQPLFIQIVARKRFRLPPGY